MAEITEQALYDAFGIEGANEQAPADPAEDTEAEYEEGANEQAPAEPAEDDTEEEEAAEDEPAEEPQKEPLTKEQRRANAARRREKEKEAHEAAITRASEEAARKAREENEAEMKEFFAQAGLKDTITGKPITNMEEFRAWRANFQKAKIKRDLASGNLTEEALASVIENHPTIKKAQQLLDRESQASRTREQQEAASKIQAEIAEIHKLDKSINSLQDLLDAPYGKELYEKVQKGYSITDAHYLLTHGKLDAARADAARASGMAAVRSKGHLRGAGAAQGAGAKSVPASEMQMYRVFNPGATDAEIAAYYNKHKK